MVFVKFAVTIMYELCTSVQIFVYCEWLKIYAAKFFNLDHVRYVLENDSLSSRPVDEKLQFLEYSPCISSNVINDERKRVSCFVVEVVLYVSCTCVYVLGSFWQCKRSRFMTLLFLFVCNKWFEIIHVCHTMCTATAARHPDIADLFIVSL